MLTELIHHILNEDLQKVTESLVDVKNKGIDINSHPDLYLCPIDYAAKKGNVEIMKLLVDPEKGGAQINGNGSQVLSPLTHAAMEGKHEVVKFLLEKGCDPKQSIGGFTALEMASRIGNIECVDAILQHIKSSDRELITKSIYQCVLHGYLNYIEDALFETCDDANVHISPHEGVLSEMNPHLIVHLDDDRSDKIKESSRNLFYTREYLSCYKKNGFKCNAQNDDKLIVVNSEENFKVIVKNKFYQVINKLVEKLT